MICETSITPEMYAELPNCEAVAVRQYERPDGTQFAQVVRCGTLDEMNQFASTPGLLIQLPGATYLGDMVVPVAELLPPSDERSN